MVAAWELNDDNRPQLLVGLPHKDSVTFEWALGFRNLQINVPAIFTSSRGCPIDMSRNEVVRSALENKCDWVFFLDTDVICPPDTITRLLAHNLPIVSGVYYTRAPPLEPAVWREIQPNGKQAIQFQPGQGLIEADFIGAGCLLIHTSVFKNIESPYFKWTLSFEDPKNPMVGRSEDFEWCKKVRSRGYKVFVDTSIICKHGISNGYTDNQGMHISLI